MLVIGGTLTYGATVLNSRRKMGCVDKVEGAMARVTFNDGTVGWFDTEGDDRLRVYDL